MSASSPTFLCAYSLAACPNGDNPSIMIDTILGINTIAAATPIAIVTISAGLCFVITPKNTPAKIPITAGSPKIPNFSPIFVMSTSTLLRPGILSMILFNR